MKPLAEYKEEVMSFFWESGVLSVWDVVVLHDEPKPNRTAVATFVRSLEQKGYLDYEVEGTSFTYFPTIERESYCGRNLKSVIRRYFDDLIQNVMNFLIKSEEYSDEEAKEIIL